MVTSKSQYFNISERSALTISINSFLIMHPMTRLTKDNDGDYTHLRNAESNKIAKSFVENIKRSVRFNNLSEMIKIENKLKNGLFKEKEFTQEVKAIIDFILFDVMKRKGL